MEKYIKLSLCFILVCLIYIYIMPKNEQKVIKNEPKPSEKQTVVVESINIEPQEEPVVEEVKLEAPKQYQSYRLTSFWFNDGYGTGSCTGSGLCENDFSVNQNGWYVYDGKLVLAAATYECLNTRGGACGKWNTKRSDKQYYHYYEEVEIVIDDIVYSGIILDSCGACMYVNNEQRMDLFVSSSKHAIDRGYKGNNTISVFKEMN